MWDENKVLELLKDMPQVLTDENLCEIQKIMDDDRYHHKKSTKKDSCGTYAPFCKICDKNVLTPCAVAYVRMKNAEGTPLKMENYSSESEHYQALLKTAKGVGEEYKQSDSETDADGNKKIRIGVGYRKYGY